MYIALLNHPDVQRGKVDFTSIKICFSGAAALLAGTFVMVQLAKKLMNPTPARNNGAEKNVRVGSFIKK